VPEAITDAEIEHLKTLAKLEMTPEDTSRAKADINAILESFQKLQELNLSQFPEMPRPVPLHNIMRDDEAQTGLEQREAMSVAVDAENGFFKVPRTVE
jgi:aspartyl-tRNA(Asn)/glutamyl-tRNA(Gln) amidotransferase subunit C